MSIAGATLIPKRMSRDLQRAASIVSLMAWQSNKIVAIVLADEVARSICELLIEGGTYQASMMMRA
jgi:hypothetical protein